jgi:hypothetical protein
VYTDIVYTLERHRVLALQSLFGEDPNHETPMFNAGPALSAIAPGSSITPAAITGDAASV